MRETVMTKPDFWDGVMIIFSLLLFLWSLHLFRHPETLTPDKFLYRWLYNRFVGLTEFGDKEDVHLTTRQIRRYAVFVMGVSVFGIVYWMYKLFFP